MKLFLSTQRLRCSSSYLFSSLSTTLIQINLFRVFRVENTCFAKRCQKQIIRNRLKYLFTDLNSIFNSKKWRICRAQRQYLSIYRIQRYLDEMERKWRKLLQQIQKYLFLSNTIIIVLLSIVILLVAQQTFYCILYFLYLNTFKLYSV